MLTHISDCPTPPTLPHFQGNILEDASAIQILSEAKIISNEIQDKEVIAERTQSEIDAARTGYKPGGAYNAILFFCIRDMAGIDPMYQYRWGGTGGGGAAPGSTVGNSTQQYVWGGIRPSRCVY